MTTTLKTGNTVWGFTRNFLPDFSGVTCFQSVNSFGFPEEHREMHVTRCGPHWTGYSDPDCIYTSGYVHTVNLVGLEPDTEYQYLPSGASRWRHFKTSPAVGRPVSFGLVADLGQTTDSLSVMQHLKDRVDDGHIDAIIFPGDISYADGYANAWDNYGRLSEFLFEGVPAAYAVGNHEYANEQFAHFLPRYPTPASRNAAWLPVVSTCCSWIMRMV